jgi:glycosyltransferase involved in cell wall biosynthesis
VAESTPRPELRGVVQVVTSTERRGAEVAATQLGAALSGRGVDVETLALWPGSGGARLEIETLGRRRRDPAALAGLVRRARHAAVVVGHGSATLPFGAAACSATRTPFVYRSIGDPEYWATTTARRARVRVAIRRARLVVAIWSGAADTLMRLYGLSGGRVEVVPNGVPVDAFTPTPAGSRAEARRALAAALGADIDPDRSLVAFLGALSPEKDPMLAVDAMASVSTAQLVVAGRGPLADELAARAAATGGGRVHVVGSTSDPALLLAASDALVIPSRSEGIPAVAIEAGMAGLPVVATAVGGVAEVVVDGSTGRLVDDRRPEVLAEALREVLEPLAGAVMGRAARERCVARFGLDEVAAMWEPLLARAAGTVR